MFSLSEAASLIAACEGRAPGEVYPQVRGLQQRGRLRGADTRGPRDACLVSHSELMLARVLMAGVDAGLVGGDIEKLEATLRFGRRTYFPVSGEFEITLEANLPRIAAGEAWVIEIARRRSNGDPETTFVWARRESSGRLNRFGSACPDPLATDNGCAAPESVTTLNVSGLLNPMIRAVEG